MKWKKLTATSVVILISILTALVAANVRADEYNCYFPYTPFTPANKTMIAYFVVDNGKKLSGITIQDERTWVSNNMTWGWTWENKTNAMGFSIEFVDEPRLPTNVTANGQEYHFNIPAPPTNGTTHVYYVTLKLDGNFILKDLGYFNLANKKITFLAVYNDTQASDGKVVVGDHYYTFYDGMGTVVTDSNYYGNITIQTGGRTIYLHNTATDTRASGASYGSIYLNLKDIPQETGNTLKTIYKKHSAAIIAGGLGFLFLLAIIAFAAGKKRRF